MAATSVGMAPHHGPALVVFTCSVPDTMTQLVRFRQKMVPGSACASDKVFVEYTAVILSTTYHWASVDDDFPAPVPQPEAKADTIANPPPQEEHNPWEDMDSGPSPLSHTTQPVQAEVTTWDFRARDAQSPGAAPSVDEWANYTYVPKTDKWQDSYDSQDAWQSGPPDPWSFKEESPWEQHHHHHSTQHSSSWRTTEWSSSGSSDQWEASEQVPKGQAVCTVPVPLAPKAPPKHLAEAPPTKVMAGPLQKGFPIDPKTGLPTKPPPPSPPSHVGSLGPPPLGPRSRVLTSAPGRALVKGTPSRPPVTGMGKVGDGQDKQVTWADQHTVIQRETSLLQQTQEC